MEKIYINAKLHQKRTFLGGATIPLPAPKKEIEEKVKELGFSDIEDIEIFYDTNLPEEFINYIDYGCYITEDKGYPLVNLGRKYTRHEKLKLYNILALCLNDLYNSDYSEDLITRFISAYAEHSAIIIELDSLPEWYYIKDSEKEFGVGSLAFLTEGTANFLKGYHVFFDYSKTNDDIYVMGAWDIDEYEGETIDDYDDDPVAYLEALMESYELYVNEDERYILDIYHTDKDAASEYKNKLGKQLTELGY